MKKIIILILLTGFMVPLYLKAQNVQDAKNLIYYERYKTAGNTLHTILKNDPANAEAWYWLSQACLRSDNADLLKDSLPLAPQDVQNDPFYMVAYGHLLLTENKKDSALQLFEQAIKKTRGKNAAILSAVANAHIMARSGDAETAIKLLNKAIKRDKRNPALYTLMGDAYRKLGKGDEAYKAYQVALHKDEHYAAALYRIGKIFTTQDNAEIYLKYFEQAVEADNDYAPALYDLYYHYYFTDAHKAMEYFKKYLTKSDTDKKNDYLFTDLLYLTRQYDQAIEKVKEITAQQDAEITPRLYKLMAYSYLGLQDTSNAMTWMNKYFSSEADSNYVVKDFETMAALYASVKGKKDSAIIYYKAGIEKTKDSSTLYDYYKKLADLYKAQKDYTNQAYWLEKYYNNNNHATNIDLFNWGIAHFKAEEYRRADTVFGRYIEKYPDQGFGYYWRARTNAVRDSLMDEGLAVPYYTQLIDIIEKKDTLSETHKKWLLYAYGYLAAWDTNKQKDYQSAIEKLKRILEIDPDNQNARQYITILEKRIDEKK